MKIDVVIIGAGASGLICAIAAGRRRRSVLVIDHAPKTGSKIRVSGGGKCNFTNLCVSSDHYISQNPHFCKSALSRFTPDDVVALFRKHRLSFHEKDGGRLFCDASSSSVITLLEKECRSAGVEILLNCPIRRVSRNGEFVITTKNGLHWADSLVIATGGLSWPALGATNIGMRLAVQFGIAVVPPRPGLVPFVFTGKEYDFFRDLSGVSFPAEVSCSSGSFRGNVLFTHRGLSGPAMLQISSYWRTGEMLSLNLLPDMDAGELLHEHRKSRKELRNLLTKYLPSRFIRAWCGRYLPVKPLCQFTEKELQEAARKLSAWEVLPAGTEGYKVAEVTVGGVDTHEISSRTMEAKEVPGLYFTGEVLDVTGQLGGYNLHWAWASGHAAGQYV
jgi:predicted Rossmann fold flavoprotein